MSGRWVDLPTAAELLNTTTEAVRKRASRGTLRSDRHDGRVVVWVDEDRTEGGREAQVDHEALLEAKDETIRVMEEQLRLRAEEIHRRDVIISQLTQANAALAQRVPELEAPAGEPASPQTHEDASGGHSQNGERVGAAPLDRESRNDSDGAREPWYRRWFGG
jgi:hypothetical protein